MGAYRGHMTGEQKQTEEAMVVVQDLSRFQLPPDFCSRPGWYVQLWWLVQGSLFAWSPQVLYGWRRFLLRRFGARLGQASSAVVSQRYPAIEAQAEDGEIHWGDKTARASLQWPMPLEARVTSCP